MILSEVANNFISTEYLFHAGVIVGVILTIVFNIAARYADSFKDQGET